MINITLQRYGLGVGWDASFVLRQSLDHSLPQQLDAEQQAFLANTCTQDFAEGLEAFFGKRPASFQGR